MPLCSAFSKVLVPPVPGGGLPPPPVANKNWNPGNYIGATSGGTKDWGGILDRLNDNFGDNNWKGALLRFQWDELERAEGEYEWTEGGVVKGMGVIRNCLQQIAHVKGKRLIIFFQIKTFGQTDNAVPQYMRDSAAYADGTNFFMTVDGVRTQGSQNGQYAYESANLGPGGCIPNMHVAAVRERLKALMQEFATRFNTHPNLEAVAFSEASISGPAGSTGKKNETVNGKVITRPNTQWGDSATGGTWSGRGAWLDNMTIAFQGIRSGLSNIQLCQWINADRSDMKPWVPDLRAAGIGLGMPDLCQEEKGFNFRNDIVGTTVDDDDPPGNIQHLQSVNGKAIVMGHASKPALEGTVVGRNQKSGTIQGQSHMYPTYPGIGPSRQQTRDFAVNTVGVTHLLWAHNTGTQPSTGERDPLAPATADPYTAYQGYAGQKYNTVTDNWLKDPASTITTVTTRPTGW